MVGTTLYQCIGVNGECNYQTSTSMPILTSVLLRQPNLIFSGTGIPMSGFIAQVSYVGVRADSTTINQNGTITAIFRGGVPVSNTYSKATVAFKKLDSNITHFATGPDNFPNSLSVKSISSSVNCSFAGGCLLTYAHPGISSNLLTDQSLN